ncbi:MAG TPA: tetratricopeptide repeat protein [Thermotogota bacterium]|nr:tetratricopeptide repeat protein [Thermotogota bacterium]HRW92762.1 tetratricopeptide repeat protein [Thermotogota bacterium]
MFVFHKSGQRASITQWSPYAFVVRDLLYDGSWEKMEMDFAHVAGLGGWASECMRLEHFFGERISGEMFLPTSSVELRSFLKNFHVNLSELRHVSEEGLYEWASECISSDDWEQAEKIALLMLDIRTESPKALEILGTLHIEKGETTQGVDLLQKALSLDPSILPAYSTLGQVFFNQGEYHKAIEQWKNIIQQDPNEVLAYFTIVDAYLNLGEKVKAVDTLLEFVQKFPHSILGNAHLYSLLSDMGRSDEAETTRGKILHSVPQSSTEMEVWARFQYEAGHFQKVEKAVQSFLDQHPGQGYLKLLLVVPLMKQGRVEEARKIVEDFKASRLWFYYGKHEIFEGFLTPAEMKRCGIC